MENQESNSDLSTCYGMSTDTMSIVDEGVVVEVQALPFREGLSIVIIATKVSLDNALNDEAIAMLPGKVSDHTQDGIRTVAFLHNWDKDLNFANLIRLKFLGCIT